jgi:NADPH-dependent 2,4-dienoyl-CoA reductase/sulfur reductase-like enzyme
VFSFTSADDYPKVCSLFVALPRSIASHLPISKPAYKEMPPLRIVIVGAGIGGLSCAIVCRKQGMDVVVLEKAEKLTPVRPKMKFSPLIFPS